MARAAPPATGARRDGGRRVEAALTSECDVVARPATSRARCGDAGAPGAVLSMLCFPSIPLRAELVAVTMLIGAVKS